MGGFLKGLVRKFPFGPYARQQQAARKPGDSQRDLLRGLLTTAAQTEWGRRNHISDVLAAPDLITAYQRQIPLARYDDVQADLLRMLRGEENVLWPGAMQYAAISGGTSSRGLYFPISDDAIQKYLQCSLTSLLAYVAHTGKSDFLRGKILTLSGGVQPHPDFPGKAVGEISGIISNYNLRRSKGGKTPKWMAVPVEKQMGADWNEKLRSIAEASLDQDIRMVVCAASWGLVLFRYVIEHYNRQHGTSVKTVGEIWPNLGLVVAGGVPLRTYRVGLQEIIGLPQVDFQEVYGATQGFFAYQADPQDPALDLWLAGSLFYEFVRVEEWGQTNARRYTLADVETGVNYVLYVSTSSGLWSQCIEDIIRFESLAPPKIIVVGRTAEWISTMGESVTGEEIQKCLESAALATNASVAEYHLAPRPASQNQSNGHQLILEFEKAPFDLTRFADAYETALQEINHDFRKWRQERGFGKTEVVAVPAGTFLQWMLATRENVRSQSKVPRARDDRSVADAVLALVDSTALVSSAKPGE